jgi:hypothetical protein
VRSGIAEESVNKTGYCCGVVRRSHIKGEIMGVLKTVVLGLLL